MGSSNSTESLKGPIFLKEKAPIIRLNLNDILWIESIGGYLSIQTSKERFTVNTTIKDIQEQLPSGQFLQINRSCVIPISKVSAINGKKLQIQDRHINIGDAFLNNVARVMKPILQIT